MNAVIGMSNILERTDLSDEQRKYLNLIKDAGTSLLDIINDILDFSKIEAGKLVIENIRFNLIDVVETCVDLLSSNAHTKRIGLLSWLDADIPAHLEGDKVRIRQILINLLSNAIKFTEKGEVIVRVKTLKRTDNETLLRFEVIDSGIGLSEEQRLKLFQPFIQADGSTTRKYGGTGLGLSICKQLVELMKGTIGVHSVQGAGSTFWFELPFTIAPQSEDDQEVPLAMPDFKKALIVDDHLAMREMATFCFNSWNIPNKAAQSGMEALKLIENEQFDLFVIDYLMPEIDGLELTRRLRQMGQFKNSRIILLTALQEESLGERAIAAGCDAFLNKPLRQSHFLDCLHSLSPEQFGKGKPRTYKTPLPSLTKSTVLRLADPQRARKILLVEDIPTNQIVATIELTRLGLDVTTAGDGSEAVEILDKSTFDLVFMDCQMPVMDGYEATAVIRKKERTTGKHVPIVAMTANALEGDREKCLAAGMDDYITKPFSPDELRSVIEKWLTAEAINEGLDATPEKEMESEQPAEESAEQSAPILDYDKLKSRFNPAQCEQLLSGFLKDTASKLAQLEAVIKEGDLTSTSKIAHGIKGAALMIFAEDLGQAARELELTAKEGEGGDLIKLYSRVQSRFEKLSDTVKGLLSPSA